MNEKYVNDIAVKINSEISKVLVGKEKIIEYLLAAYFAGGHVLLEDIPGTGKTMLAKSLAKTIAGSFKRIQFTPDLLPSDITGLNYYNQKQEEFIFREGSVFANIILADEINRATPRTQSSLLECMEEGQISVDGETRLLPQPFFIIATQNPLESLGTFPLPEAQLDRFMMKLNVGLPNYEQELDIINKYILDNPSEKIKSVCTVSDILQIREEIKKVFISYEVRKYMLNIVCATRECGKVIVGASPRSTISFLRAVQAFAAINGRDYVIPDDVKELAPYLLGHRIKCLNGIETNNMWNLVRNLVSNIEVPVENFYHNS